MSESLNGPVELYRARNLLEAETIRLCLESEGIQVTIFNEALQGALGEVPLGWSSAPQIVVNQKDFSAAKNILDEFLRGVLAFKTGAEASLVRCLACGVEMPQASTCGNCGWSYESESSVADDSSADATEIQQTDDRCRSATESAIAIEASSSMTDSEIWWEVFAVLAVGVIPYLSNVLPYEYFRESSPPFWIEFVSLLAYSACAMYITLYLVFRSGESWERFGITRLRASDLFLCFVLFLVARIVHVVWWELTGGMETFGVCSFPSSRLDYALLIVTYGVAGLSEEIITRAYLITRLERLLRSRFLAVLTSAALFASYHLYQGVGGAFYALLFGLAYGGAFLLLRSVWPLAMGHALYNIYLELL